MIRTIVKLGLLLLVVVLVYNYCFGDQKEKEQSRQIFGQVGALVRSAADLVRDERAKFDAGKYDAALDKVGDAYRTIRTQAKKLDAGVENRLSELERRKATLQQQLDTIESTDQELAQSPAKPIKKNAAKPDSQAAKRSEQESRKERLQRELDDLLHDTDALIKEQQK